MSATTQRDHAIQIAASAPEEALSQAEAISDPWFAAQALAAVLRYCPCNRAGIVLRRATDRVATCHDAYSRGAVSAWVIGALVGRGMVPEAESLLRSAIEEALKASPNGSRGEALFLLYQAAYPLGTRCVEPILRHLFRLHGTAAHWRVTRAAAHAGAMHAVQAADAVRSMLDAAGDPKLTAKVNRYISLGFNEPRQFFWQR